MRGLTFFLLSMLAFLCPQVVGQTPEEPKPNGNRFVAQVLSNLVRQPNISAKLHHESRLHDQKLSGSGEYLQLGQASRWEMRTQIADQTASFLQIYDGEHLWTDHRLPNKRYVRRLEVGLLQAKLRNAQRSDAVEQFEPLVAALEGQGGLVQMLVDLMRNFDFQTPQPIQLEGVALHAVIGRWKPQQLVRLWPNATQLTDAEPPAWPEQLPHHVLLLVGKNLFPYVCEHRRQSDAALANSLAGLRPTSDPLLFYQIYDVQFAAPIAQERLRFAGGDVQFTDETTLVFEQLTRELEQKTSNKIASRRDAEATESK